MWACNKAVCVLDKQLREIGHAEYLFGQVATVDLAALADRSLLQFHGRGVLQEGLGDGPCRAGGHEAFKSEKVVLRFCEGHDGHHEFRVEKRGLKEIHDWCVVVDDDPQVVLLSRLDGVKWTPVFRQIFEQV